MRFVLAFSFCISAFANSPAKVLDTALIRFEPRSGVTRWIAKGLNHSIGFTDRSTLLRLGDRTVTLTLPGSSRRARFDGTEPLVSTNYFSGSHYASVPTFSRLHRMAVYPGIDVVYYGNGGELEYDFEIAPGANPSAIRMRFDGADRVRLNQRGEVVLSLGAGEIVQRTPVVYQRRPSGEIVAVKSAYRIDQRGDVRVDLGEYNPADRLVVDPAITYSAYLQGSSPDIAIAIAHDANGNIYLAGNTWSTDFPVTPDAEQLTYGGNSDVWVMKLNPSLGSSAIVYCTYLGGAAIETLKAMTVDANGVVYLTGTTNSSGFPVSSGALQSTITSNTHAFVTMLDPSQAGSAGLIYSTYLGGANTEEGDAIVVANGKIYVTGNTTSDNFPLVGASLQTTRVSGFDGFIAEFDPTQSGASSLIYSTYLGGSGQDLPHAIAVDPAGNIYVAGITYSNDFPTTPTSYQPFYSNNQQGDGDGFLTELNPNTGVMLYSTYLGGTLTDDVKKIVVEPGGHVALAGFTQSFDFPISQNAYQPAFKPQATCQLNPVYTCAPNGFLTILDLTATTPLVQGLVYSTYFGGTGGDVVLDLRRDSAGRYVMGGYTLSSDFPVTANALSSTTSGFGIDGFIAILDPVKPPTSQLVYSSYVTGPGFQVVYGVDVDASGLIYAAGFSTSNLFTNGVQDSNVGKMSGFMLTMTLQ